MYEHTHGIRRILAAGTDAPVVERHSPRAGLAEDGVKYEQFNQQSWTVKQARTDDQGRFLLVNRPVGRTFCQVFWADPKTQHPRWGIAYVNIEEQEPKTPQDIQVTEK